MTVAGVPRARARKITNAGATAKCRQTGSRKMRPGAHRSTEAVAFSAAYVGTCCDVRHKRSGHVSGQPGHLASYWGECPTGMVSVGA